MQGLSLQSVKALSLQMYEIKKRKTINLQKNRT